MARRHTIHAVLAGAYPGRQGSYGSLLIHASEDGGYTALCGRVKPGHLADVNALPAGEPVTCKHCLRKAGDQ